MGPLQLRQVLPRRARRFVPRLNIKLVLECLREGPAEQLFKRSVDGFVHASLSRCLRAPCCPTRTPFNAVIVRRWVSIDDDRRSGRDIGHQKSLKNHGSQRKDLVLLCVGSDIPEGGKGEGRNKA